MFTVISIKRDSKLQSRSTKFVKRGSSQELDKVEANRREQGGRKTSFAFYLNVTREVERGKIRDKLGKPQI